MLSRLKRGLFLTLPVGMLGTTALGRSSDCPAAEAARWAQQHRANLPSTVAEMSRLDRTL